MLGRVRHESARRMFELFGIITTAQLLDSGRSPARSGRWSDGAATPAQARQRPIARSPAGSRPPRIKGPGSRAAGLAMAFKLIESARDRWRAVNAPHLVVLVRAGAVFVNGKLVERPGEDAPPQAA
jgi:hypothetical protein